LKNAPHQSPTRPTTFAIARSISVTSIVTGFYSKRQCPGLDSRPIDRPQLSPRNPSSLASWSPINLVDPAEPSFGPKRAYSPPQLCWQISSWSAVHQYLKGCRRAQKARRSCVPGAPPSSQSRKALRPQGPAVCNHAGAYYLCAFSNAMGTCPVPFVRHCCQFATTRRSDTKAYCRESSAHPSLAAWQQATHNKIPSRGAICSWGLLG
jgi:hypothetical protein